MLIFIQKIKGEPWFTTEESYNELKNLSSKKVKTKKEFSELLIDDCDKLIKSIDKLNSETIDKKSEKALFGKLKKVKESIDILLKGNNIYE